MKINHNNYTHLKGNVTRKPVIVHNEDGSHTVFFILAVRDDHKNPRTGRAGTYFVSCQHYMKRGTGIYDHIHAGTPLEITAFLQTVPVKDRSGIRWNTFVYVNHLELCETPVVREARAACNGDAEAGRPAFRGEAGTAKPALKTKTGAAKPAFRAESGAGKPALRAETGMKPKRWPRIQTADNCRNI